MINKKISQALIFSFILFLLISGVNAVEDNISNEASHDSSFMLASDLNEITVGDYSSNDLGIGAIDVSNSDNLGIGAIDVSNSNDLELNGSNLNNLEIDNSNSNDLEINSCDSIDLKMDDSNSELKDSNENNKIKLEDAEGEYVDASEAYGYLNAFRTEENVWYWNSDDSTKSYVNTNDTVWLKPLERDGELEETAKLRAKEISEYFSHIRPDGTWCFTAFPDDLYDYGENIAYAYQTCEEVTEGWKETNESYDGQGHRRTMLQTDFNYVGIAGYKINGTIYWVQNFGCRYDPKDIESNVTFHFDNNVSNPQFSIELPNYATGRFSVKVDGNEIIEKHISNGRADFTVYGLNPGSHTVELSYLGDYNCNPVNKTETINVIESEVTVESHSFNYLNTLIQMAEGEVKLENDYTFDKNHDADLISGIIISKALTIDGQGHQIDAGGQGRIFKITVDGIVLENLGLINGEVDSLYTGVGTKYFDDSGYGVTSVYYASSNIINEGGAIFSHGTFSIINSTFINNTAGTKGGAVYSYGTPYLSNSTFISNTAGTVGGAVYSDWYLSCDNVNFTSNHANELGGAAYVYSNLEAVNSTFAYNTNTQVYVGGNFLNNNSKFIYDDYYNVFINATEDKGIVNMDKDFNASQMIVINGSNVIIDGNGYTIDAQNKSRVFYITGNNVTIRNLRIINGLSKTEGGAIYDSSLSNLAIINSTFANNIAERGGAIFAQSNLSVIGSNFTDNEVKDFSATQDTQGGAICTNSSELFIENSRFINNTALNGGAIHHENGTTTINDSYFKANNATIYGGGVLYTNMDVNITNSTFLDNEALRYGGAIFAYEEAKICIRDSTFTNNTSYHYGGAVSAAVLLDISNSTFSQNNATDHGGAISVWGEVQINNSRFIDNLGDVGVVFIYCQTSKANIISSEFLGNTVNQYGALYVTSNVFIRNSTFVNNTALKDNGGVVLSFQNLTVENSTFINNYASGAGGALYNAGEDLIVKNSTFINNSVGEGDITSYCGGGAIANYGLNLSVDDSIFVNNSAIRGGAIFNSPNGNVSVFNSQFDDNHAYLGGAIDNENYHYGEGDYNIFVINVKNSKFNNNTASSGGAIYNLNGTVNILNSTLTDNNGSVGESIKDNGGVVNLINSTLKNSNAVDYALVGRVNHINSTILENMVNVTKEYLNYTRVISQINSNGTNNGTNTSGNGTNHSNGTGNGTGNGAGPTNGTGPSIPSNGTGNGTNPSNGTGPSIPSNGTGNGTNGTNANLTKDRIATKIIYNDMTTGPVAKKDGRIGNYFCVKLVDNNNNALAGVPIKIGFNGVIYNRITLSDGSARLQINLMKEDLYTFAICFLGDDEYNASFEVAKITVDKKYPKPNKANSTATGAKVDRTQKNTRLETSIVYTDMVTESVLKVDGRVGKYFTVKLVDNKKKALANVPIKIGFNGVIYNRTTNASGQARLQINLAKVTLYTFAISYLGDEKYQASFAVAKIAVNKHTPKLAAPAKTFKANAKTKTVTATLKSANGNAIKGKKISFTVNGKTYTGTTNAKGLASVKISLSKKGTYTAIAKFAGDSSIKATSTKFKVKIS